MTKTKGAGHAVSTQLSKPDISSTNQIGTIRQKLREFVERELKDTPEYMRLVVADMLQDLAEAVKRNEAAGRLF